MRHNEDTMNKMIEKSTEHNINSIKNQELEQVTCNIIS